MAAAAPKRAVIAPRRPSTTSLTDSAAVVERTEGNKIELGAKPVSEEEMVTAIVPKAFMLTLDDHTPVQYPAGTQEMPLSHASHWFSRSQGVKVYEPKK